MMGLRTFPFLAAYTIFPLTIVAAVKGGWYVLVPFWSVIAVLDFIIGDNLHNPSTKVPRSRLVFSDLLVWLWVPSQVLMYIVVYYQFFHADHLGIWERGFVLFAAGRATALSLTVAHELSHRRSRWEKSLGEFMMSCAGLGYYSTEHVYVHHTHVATPRDPVTALKGESVYRFICRSWAGAIANSWLHDLERLRRRGLPPWHPSNPWWRYLAVLLFLVAGSWSAAALSPWGYTGWHGVALYLGIVVIANVNLRGIDYIEHYGLLRAYTGKGRFEHAKPRHSWNSARRISSYFMFNVQRHSDHHYKPARPYPLLQTYGEDQAAQMPANYIAMYCIAMIPPLWRRIMHPRLEAWRRKFYPEIEDWSTYDSPLFHKYPEKYPVIAEVMARDARLSGWMHRHPTVLEGRYTPEQAHLSLADVELEDEWEQIASRGLVAVFYRKELTPQEIEDQLSELTRASESVNGAASAIRPWLEDRSFQLGLYLLKGRLDLETATEAFVNIVEGAVLHLANVIDRDFDAEFDEPSTADAPAVVALGSLARGDLGLGDVLSLTVDLGEGGGKVHERSGADLERFQNDWTQRFLRGLRRLFHNDFPCRLSGTLEASPPVCGTEAQPARRLLRP